MKKTTSFISAVVTLASLSMLPIEVTAKEMSGKKIAFDRKLGNCLGCHMISGGSQPGNAGPPLIAMKARYPDKAQLKLQIWDATIKNPDSLMPPFGKHKVLTESQIDKITDFIYSL